MAELIYMEPQVDIIKTFRPDFSDFSAPIINWHASIAASMDNESFFSIEFAGIPEYKGWLIEKGDTIEFNIPQVDKVAKLKVRQMSYTMEAEKATTSLLLKTNKIELDQYIPGGGVVGPHNGGYSAVSVFKKLFSLLGIDSNVQGDETLDWPCAKNSTININGRQNVLEWLKEQLGKNPPFDYWFDIYNNFNVQRRLNPKGQNFVFDFNNLGPVFDSFTATVADRFDEQEISVSTDTRDPTAKIAPSVNTVVSVASIEKDRKITIKNETAKGRVGSNETNDMPEKSLKTVAVYNYTAELKLRGMYFIEPHEIVEIRNFPAANDNYVLKGLTIYEKPIPTTIIILETQKVDIEKPNDKSDKVDDKNTNKPSEIVEIIVGADRSINIR